ncbi:MAG: hypothetical protein CMP45_00280 [Rickettsiales bacterium]|nr:hypothetical protein [Rickettsiales bacterium]|tara:strand:+ start:5042 stop:5263 length:222 start_codon:yes stop_codon:yes gene_type:complete
MKKNVHIKLQMNWTVNPDGSAILSPKFLRGNAITFLEVDTVIHPAWTKDFTQSKLRSTRKDNFNIKFDLPKID